MLNRVLYTHVLVSDQDEALSYYTDVLGLEKRVDNQAHEGPRFLAVGVEGQDLSLVLWPGKPGAAEPAFGRVPAAYTLEVDDCEHAYDQLKERGVRFVTDVLEFPWGRIAMFEDPDGNRLQIRQGL
ncbi:MAG TPA: VOC family protein [Solirubrobacterales bacterium]